MFESEIGASTTATAAGRAWFLDQVAGAADDPEFPGGRTIVVERRARGRGLMPPLSERDVDESYYIVEGELTFFVGGDEVSAAAGDVVVAPAGVRRTFRVESERARWLVLTHVSRPGLFDDFGRAVAQPVGDDARESWSDAVSAVSAIGAPNGIRVLGPPGLLPSDLS